MFILNADKFAIFWQVLKENQEKLHNFLCVLAI